MTNTNKLLQKAILSNAKLGNKLVTKNQIGDYSFSVYTSRVENLLEASYTCFREAHDNNGQTDVTPIYESLKPILKSIGTFNNVEIKADANSAIVMMAFAGKEVNTYSNEYHLAMDKLRNDKKRLERLQKINGASKESIKALIKSVDESKETLKELKKEEGSIVKITECVSLSTFRGKLERFINARLNEITMRDFDAIQKEREALKEDRAARAKARRKAKKEAIKEAAKKAAKKAMEKENTANETEATPEAEKVESEKVEATPEAEKATA